MSEFLNSDVWGSRELGGMVMSLMLSQFIHSTHTHITKFGGVMVDGIKTLEFQNMF